MEEKILKGTISFVNHEKNFATIEYEMGAKKKSITFKITLMLPKKKTHHFRPGDTVSFS